MESSPNALRRLPIKELQFKTPRLQLIRPFSQPLPERKGETHFGPIPDFSREILSERLDQQRLVHAVSEFYLGRNTGDIFNQSVIQKRHAGLDGMSHAHEVNVLEQLVLKVMPEFEKGEGVEE